MKQIQEAPRGFKPGLVLHLNPEELLAQGARHNVAEDHRVRGDHFFVCVKANEDTGVWLPCYSSAGPGRIEIPRLARVGHPKWAANDCYFHPAQVWTIPHSAVTAAAKAAGDRSTARRRNLVKLDYIVESGD